VVCGGEELHLPEGTVPLAGGVVVVWAWTSS
jgi:hypothetical protein